MSRLLLPILAAILLISIPILQKSTLLHDDTVNAVLGDKSYTNTFGIEPDAATSEEVRIKTHLEYVIDLLKKKDVSGFSTSQIENRWKLIALLEDYKETGVFPKNRHFETRRPVFIDEDGNLCAVGHLIAQTEGLETAEEINRNHKFDYIKDIEPKLIDGWLAVNGITKNEAAMIQPAYHSEETVNQNNIETEYAVASSFLAGAQLGTLGYSLLTKNSSSNIRKVSIFNTALGATSLTIGLMNLDNTTSVTSSCQDGSICMWTTTTTYKNPSRTNLSIANIIVGGLSAAFNGYRFFRANDQEDPAKFNVSATQLYEPTTQTINPGLSLSMNF